MLIACRDACQSPVQRDLSWWPGRRTAAPYRTSGFSRHIEAYDPATNTWDGSLPRMRIPRHGFAGAVIADRLHVVAGGIQTAGIPGAVVYTDTHDVFDFTKN
jgi:hypothetical protein